MVNLNRSIKSYILDDVSEKIVLVSGPRQTGKTTLSKGLFSDFDYLNYDLDEDRIALAQKSWDRSKPIVIFDELHKMNDWKRWLKGIYDSEGVSPKLIVTGSARMNVFRKVGDSLAGRFFSYKLHPLDLKEAASQLDMNLEDVFARLMQCSGFPEPFLNGGERFYRRWRRSHVDMILRQDLLDLAPVRDIQAIETMIQLLHSRVGATVSYASLARDLGRDAKTVKYWCELLENLYIIFKITPYSKNIARSILKEPKYYFYDYANIKNEGAKLENMVAHALLKELDFIEDTQGIPTSLHFIRNKEGHEIDFLVNQNHVPTHLFEVKNKDSHVSPHFDRMSVYLGELEQIQLVKDLAKQKTFPNGVCVTPLIPYLSKLNLYTERL